MEGQSLADYLDATAHLGKIPSPAEIVHLLIPIATALDSAHRRGELHGALKPSVILLDTRRATPSSLGEPVLTNFGMYQRQDPRLLSSNDASYIAPEIAQGQAGTSRSDLYSLGIILYELCTGALPFLGETPNDVLMQHVHGVPISPVLINPYIRPALTAVIMRGLARDPVARFSSATALVTAAAKAMNVSVPESTSHSDPALPVMNPSSVGNISDPNAPTYLVSPSPSQSGPFAPTIASSNTPALSRPPAIPSITPILPLMSTGDIPQAQLAQRPMGSLFTRLPSTKRRRRSVLAALALLLIAVILGSVVLFYLVAIPTSQPPSTLVGQAFFISSGLISKESNQGITDGLRISLKNINDPLPGKRYYGWLTTSGTEVPIALGPLPVDHGQIIVTYNNPYHNNLLAHYSRFLVTEEDASQQPINPSLDVAQWRYSSAFSTVSNQADPNRFALLDHLRHLLAEDPKLNKVGLQGGLSVWLFRNTTKILEAAGSARDTRKECVEGKPETCDTDLILRQVARILDYLDGAQYIQRENIPSSIQGSQLLIDPNVARVALLEFDPVNQQPPGYLEHIGRHLQDLNRNAGVTPDQRKLANHINQDINNVQEWLNAVHANASDLIHMSPAELLQPAALTKLNDLFTQANSAFVGQVDPNTGIAKEGVVQIYYNIQALATFDVALCTIKDGQNSCVEGGN